MAYVSPFILFFSCSPGPVEDATYAAEDRLDSLIKSLAKDTSVPSYLDSTVNELALAKPIQKDSGAEALPQPTGAIGKSGHCCYRIVVQYGCKTGA